MISLKTFRILPVVALIVLLSSCSPESPSGKIADSEQAPSGRSGVSNGKKHRARHRKHAPICRSQHCVAGRRLLRQRKFRPAVNQFKLELNSNPHCAWAYFGIARAHRMVKEDDKAIEYARRAISFEPDLAEAHNLLAVIYDDQERYELALEEANLAIQCKPKMADPYYYRASSAFYISMVESGPPRTNVMADLNRAIRLNPNLKRAYALKGTVLASRHKMNEAIECFSRGLEIGPDANLYAKRSAAYSYLNRYDEALADLAEYSRLEPMNPVPYKTRAGIDKQLNRYDQALVDYGKAMELVPGDYSNFMDRALVYVHMKRYEDALRDYGHVIDSVKDDDEALRKRSEVYVLMGRLKDALADLDHAHVIDPDSTMTLIARSKLLDKMGKKESAELDRQQAKELSEKEKIGF
ncbi:MAG: tetratricopeptide repeat protein [Candidatus Obscuribacterales bacterium]